MQRGRNAAIANEEMEALVRQHLLQIGGMAVDSGTERKVARP